MLSKIRQNPALIILGAFVLTVIGLYASSAQAESAVHASPDGIQMRENVPQAVILAGGAAEPRYVPPPLEFLQKVPAGADIRVNYSGSWTTEAQNAFEYAVGIWESQLNSSVTIVVNAEFKDLGQNVLGSAGPGTFYRDFTNAPQSNTWYPIAIVNSLVGSDIYNDAEINAQFSSTFNWYYGTDGNPGSQYDFVTVVLHELGHGLGFLGSMNVNSGVGSWGNGSSFPFIYDRFTEDAAGTSLLNYQNNSTALGNALLTSDNIFFDGPLANVGNGGARVPLISTINGQWYSGSSYSHLDEDYNNTVNDLMTYSVGWGVAIHDPGPVAMGMFRDMGWTVPAVDPIQTPTPTVTYTPEPTNTFTPTPTFTYTPEPTNTFTPTPTFTYTPEPTNTPTPTNTPAPIQTTLNNAGGGTLTYTDAQGDQTIITVPSGAVTETLKLIYQADAPGSAPDGFRFAGTGFHLSIQKAQSELPEFTFQKPITITLNYSDSDVANTDEENLVLNYWDTTSSAWVDAATTCVPTSTYQRDTANNRLTVEICHLTEFGLFAPTVIRTVYLPTILRDYDDPDWVTIIDDGFEGAFPDSWVTVSLGDTNYAWGQRACNPASGSYAAWGIGGGASGSGKACDASYPNDLINWLVFGPFDLSDATKTDFVFKSDINLSEITNDMDLYQVLASVDGANFYGATGPKVSGGWQTYALDLTNIPNIGNLIGQPQVWVAFYLQTDAVGVEAGGVYLDDILLRKCTGTNCPATRRKVIPLIIDFDMQTPLIFPEQ